MKSAKYVTKEEAAEYEKEKEELRLSLKIIPNDDSKVDYEPLSKKFPIMNQLDWKLLRWKLYESCGVHTLFIDGTPMEINMLVEKKYPLIKELLEKMLNLRLEAEEESTMAFELIKFFKSLLEEYDSSIVSLRARPSQVVIEPTGLFLSQRLAAPVRDTGKAQSIKVKIHLTRDGFTRGYTCCDFHGEKRVVGSTSECNMDDDLPINNDRHDLNNMLDDLDVDVVQKEHAKYEKLFVAAEKALFGGCTKLTILSAVIKLFKIKASFGWSDISFTTLLEFLYKQMLPDDNALPISTYQAKKLMCPIDLEIERINACPNNCMLYRGDDKDLHACKYFSIIPRLERLYADANEAKLLRWHAEERQKDGKMRHVADSLQWRNIDNSFEEFGGDIRNIRLGLCSSGFNPFGNMSTSYSTYQVLLCNYNLPPWKMIYMGHRRSLLRNHPYRKKKELFDGTIECAELRPPLDEEAMFSRDLAYWEHLQVRHCLDIMHIKKNVCESLIYLLLNITGKTKDVVNVRHDMEDIGIRPELAAKVIPRKRGTYLPSASYTMSKIEKTMFCQCLHGIKVPSGYSANIKKLVSMKDLKLSGMK
ncbi:putative TNP-like transposable element [Tanacetum coccineum]|uniref:TNP-like transposable element n=1 Tax=Tanacetum coccineum TaxID=301880 RepID=A0ABQ4YWF8_9ASTR